MRNAKSRRGNQILAAAVGAAGVMLLSGAADAATYQVGSGYTYSTVQAALNAAQTGGSNGEAQIVRIMDSGNYTSEDLTLGTGSWGTRTLSLEANTGAAPKLFAITLAQTIGGVTLKGLNFESPLTGKSNNGAVVIASSSLGTAPITITDTNFKQFGNSNNGWVNSVYIRADTTNPVGKITVANSNFDMTAAPITLDASGVRTAASMVHKINLEVSNSVFLGGYRGVLEASNGTPLTGSAVSVHNNLFHSQNLMGVGKDGANTSSLGYLTVENNTFVNVWDRSSIYGGAIFLRGSTTLDGSIIDNLIVDDSTNASNAGITWSVTNPISANGLDNNAFVKMTSGKVAFWNSALKTLTDLNGLTDTDTNIEKLADGSVGDPTLANLFATYGGSDYRNDYKLKAGVWALTAASDGQFVGAFAAVPEPSAIALLAPGALMAIRRRRRS